MPTLPNFGIRFVGVGSRAYSKVQAVAARLVDPENFKAECGRSIR